MRELIYYVAATLDGFIARADGSYDAFPWDVAYGEDLAATFPETVAAPARSPEHIKLPNKWFDIVLMGRKTYDVGAQVGLTSPYPTLQQYVFSRSMKESPDPQVTLVSDDTVGVVRELKQGSGKAIWLCGGSELATVLFGADLIDKLIVKLNPVVFGTGIPLFASIDKPTTLEMTDSKIYPSGHSILHYQVQR